MKRVTTIDPHMPFSKSMDSSFSYNFNKVGNHQWETIMMNNINPNEKENLSKSWMKKICRRLPQFYAHMELVHVKGLWA